MWRNKLFFGPLVAMALMGGLAWADPILTATNPNFTLVPLGTVSGPPASFQYAGLAFSGSNLLLAGTDASAPAAQFETVYSVPVNRGVSGQITSLGNATTYANVQVAPSPVTGAGLAGGLTSLPNGTLMYTTLPSQATATAPVQSYIGQYSFISNSSSLTPVGLVSNAGSNNNLTSLGSVPLGGVGVLPNGGLVVSTATNVNSPSDPSNGYWYPVGVSATANASGFYSITVGTSALTTQQVPADSFAVLSSGVTTNVPTTGVLVGESVSQQVALYGFDQNGNPTGSPQVLVTAAGTLTGLGLVRDPSTPSYVFTSSNGTTSSLVLLTTGSAIDAPEPSGTLLAFGGIALLLLIRRFCWV